MRVLIIDDEEDVRRIATLSLAHVGGHEVHEASGGIEGIALAKRCRPDVILLDVMMPGMDGTATLEALLREAETAMIPVVFVTARAMADDVARLRSLGAAGVLTKPFNGMTLSRELQRVLEEAQ